MLYALVRPKKKAAEAGLCSYVAEVRLYVRLHVPARGAVSFERQKIRRKIEFNHGLSRVAAKPKAIVIRAHRHDETIGVSANDDFFILGEQHVRNRLAGERFELALDNGLIGVHFASVSSLRIVVSSADPAFQAHKPSRFNSAARNLIRAARGVILNSVANVRRLTKLSSAFAATFFFATFLFRSCRTPRFAISRQRYAGRESTIREFVPDS